MNNPYQWRTPYAAALLEGDDTQVRLQIEKAEEAIHVRMRELPQKFFVGSEQAELQSALRNLRLWRAGRLKSA